jgi:hypothetical protein
MDTPLGDELIIQAHHFIDRRRLSVELTDLEARMDGFVETRELKRTNSTSTR